ncbi:DUF1311 domain-containing protein [Sphingobium sp. Cam5-1]|uniref:DUF1311 domain-containing protein n=2 Tax=unclassified Sphingobium TaxID=2611147 RepID=UPI0018AD2BA6|nr:DUF1311 domain-containing protein [Sphingobium sp. Cam5-1]QPI75375.1 DUF1311 domain-containing protein [Sphingobium sp. Cam5-1]
MPDRLIDPLRRHIGGQAAGGYGSLLRRLSLDRQIQHGTEHRTDLHNFITVTRLGRGVFKKTGVMMVRSVVGLLLASACLAGCGNVGSPFGEKLSCSSAAGQDTTISIIKDEVEKTIFAGSQEAYGAVISKSKIRAALDQIKFLIEDVRTSKEDPNSTKKFCTGKLKIVFPDAMITDADKTRELQGVNKVSELADNSGAEREANAFTMDIDFNVQPTDDGEKVYSELENADAAPTFVSAILGGHLGYKMVQQSHQQEQQQTQLAEQQEQAALTEQKQATLGEAKAEFDLSTQTINAIWGSIPSDQRDQILSLQRAWIKKKTADCKVEAAQASLDPAERESTRLRCEARMNNERSGQLRRFTYGNDTGY